MKHDRPGDWLWHEWDGFGYEPQNSDAVVYVSYGDLDIDSDLVKRALASALQRDGVAFSLGNGFTLIGAATITHGFAGAIDDGIGMSVCSDEGITDFGDEVEERVVATWVELTQ